MKRGLIVRLLVVLAVNAVIIVVLRGLLALSSVTTSEATTVMVVIGTLLIGSGVAMVCRMSVVTYRARDNNLLLVLWSLCVGTSAVMLLPIMFDVTTPVAVGAGAVVTIVAGLWYRRTTARDMDEIFLKNRYVEPHTAAEARAMVEVARRAGAQGDLDSDRRLLVELNLSRALITLSMLDREPAALDEARGIVQRLLTTPVAAPRQALAAAADLFDAVDSYAKETGDGSDYQVVMRIFEDLARDLPDAVPLIHQQRADHAVFQTEIVLGLSTGRKRPEEVLADAVRWLSVAKHELDQTIGAATDPTYRAFAQIKLALVRCQLAALAEPEPGATFDAAELLAREAIPVLPGRQRVFGYLTLAQCLLHRVDGRLRLGEPDDPVIEVCLDEVERICRRQLRRPTDFEPGLRATLVEALVARQHVSSSAGASGDALDAARAAYRATLRYRNVNRVPAADAWCAEAVAHGDAANAAEAYWERIMAAAGDTGRQVPLTRQRQFLAGDGILAEAGFRVLAAGRTEDAVRLLEYGRGINLRRLLGAVTARQRAQLLSHGHNALVQAYEAAVAELADLLRQQHYLDRPSGSTVSVGTRQYDLRGFDPIREAQARVRSSEEAIAVVLGDGTGPLPYAEIQAAACTAPIVYLGAARDGGFAVTVTSSGPPVPTVLPNLQHDLVARLAADIGARGPAGEVPLTAVDCAVEELAPLLEPLVDAFRPLGTTMTLVPLGPLGLLPLHAVFVLAGLVVRHTPSARGLPPEARSLPSTATVLTVEAVHPNAPMLRDLTLVPAQTELLTRMYGTRLHRLPDAVADRVLAEFVDADVCHFLCHGVADAMHPYESSLFLSDRRLRLSEMLARAPRPQRLVILGACESSASDPVVVDEMVSFPGALLQAGVQGVVAALWRVSENAAALVLQRFHEGIASGRPPVTALAEAQLWLRSATRGEITRRYPGLYRNRLSADPTVRPFADPVEWAAFTYTGV